MKPKPLLFTILFLFAGHSLYSSVPTITLFSPAAFNVTTNIPLEPGAFTGFYRASFTFGPISVQQYGTPDFDPGATSSSPITYTSSNISVATILSGKIHILNVGTAIITATNGGTSLQQTLTIIPGVQTITFSQQNAVYGNPDFNPAAASNTTNPIYYKSSDTTIATITATNFIHIKKVGTTVITAAQAGNSLYNAAAQVTQTLTVHPALLTIVTDNQTRYFGQPNPPLTATYYGFVNGDTTKNLTVKPTITTTAAAGSPAAAYAYQITASGAMDPNYKIEYQQYGYLTILPSQLIFNPFPQIVYGYNPQNLSSYNYNNYNTISNVDFDPGATTGLPVVYTSSNNNVATIVSDKIHITGAGKTVITAASGGSTISQTLDVHPAPLYIYVNDTSKYVGQPNPQLPVYYSGFVNGDTAKNLTSQPTVTTTATTSSGAGIYPITLSGAGSLNYFITYQTSSLTILPSQLLFNPIPQIVYGYNNYNDPNAISNTDFDPMATSGSPITYTSSNENVAAIISNKIHVKSAGKTFITASSGESKITQTLTIRPAYLYVFVDDTTKVAGQPNPIIPILYEGFVNGDNNTNLTQLPVITTTATTSSDTGSYSITISGAIDSNYTISYGIGTLTVIPAASRQLIFKPLPTAIYGNPDFAPGAVSATPIAYSSSNTAVAYITSNMIHITGAGTTVITATSNGISIPQTLTVQQAPLTIYVEGETKFAGQANPALTIDYYGFVNNDDQTSLTRQPIVSTTATAASPVGNYPITASGAVGPNYIITYENNTLSIVSPQQLAFNPLQNRQYGNSDFDPGATSGTNITYSSSNIAVAVIVSNMVHIVGAGTTVITAASGSTSISQTLIVQPVPLTIYVYNVQKTVGQANPPFPLFYQGFVNGDDQTNLTAQAIVSTTATTSSPPGTYPINISGATDPNYTISYNPYNGTGVLTVIPSQLVFGPISPLTYGYYGHGSYGFDPGATSGTGIQYTSSNTAVAYVNSQNLINISGAGTTQITATSGGSTITQTLTVNPAVLSIFAYSQTIVQGQPIPAFQLGYNGFVYAEDQSYLSVPPVATVPVSNSSVPGTYPITVSGAVDPNYIIRYNQNNSYLTITPYNLVFNPLAPVTYGAYDFSAGATSGTPITYSSSNTAVATIVSNRIHVVGAGTTVITATSASGTQSQILTVNKAPLLFYGPGNVTIIQGQPMPVFGIEYYQGYDGFVNGDNFSSLTVQPTATTTATSSSPPGIYPITVSGAIDPNYLITYDQTSTLTIIPYKLVFNPIPARTYGNSDFSPGATSGTLITYTSSDTAVAKIVSNMIHITGAGATTITATSGNTSLQQTLMVYPAQLQIQVSNQTRFFGQPNPVFSFSYYYFVNGDNAGSLTVQPTVSTTANISSPPGTYPITVSGAVDPNYTISYYSATLTILPAQLAFNPIPSKYYGYGEFDPGATSTSPITYISSNISVASIVSNLVKINSAGTTIITATSGGNSLTQTLTVLPARLYLYAIDQTRIFGQPNPVFTFNCSGFVNGDGLNSLSVQPVLSTTATVSSTPGTYPITISGAVDSNYTFNYQNATLTINPVPLVFNPIPAKTYGNADFDPGATSSANITYTSSNTNVAYIVANEVHIVTVGTTTITATSDGVSLSQTLTVQPAVLTISAVDQTAKYYGAIPQYTFAYSGFVNGDGPGSLTSLPTATSTVTSTSNVGSYPITLSGADDPNYTIQYVPGTIQIQPILVPIPPPVIQPNGGGAANSGSSGGSSAPLNTVCACGCGCHITYSSSDPSVVSIITTISGTDTLYSCSYGNPGTANVCASQSAGGDFLASSGCTSVTVNAPLSVSLIDPYPNMVNKDGTLVTDVSKIDLTKVVKGAATDGVSKILVVAKATSPVEFRLTSSDIGSLSQLDGPASDPTDLIIQPQNGLAVAVYTSPDGYGSNMPPAGRNITVNANYIDDPGNVINQQVLLVTPPVILVHGMWSDRQVWNTGGFQRYLLQHGINNIYLADYSQYSAQTFDPNNPESEPARNAIWEQRYNAYSDMKKSGIVAVQADYVGHSLGGLQIRNFSQDPLFTQSLNYGKGFIHKLITLGTPHRGTPLGPALWNARNNIMFFIEGIPIQVWEVMALFNKPIGTCHRDFNINLPSITNLSKTLPFKSYAICGNYEANPNDPETKSQNVGYYALNGLTLVLGGTTLNTLFASRCNINKVLPNDLIVPQFSQIGNIGLNNVYFGTGHSFPASNTETNNPLIQQQVDQLLLSNKTFGFSNGFPAFSSSELNCNTTDLNVPNDIVTSTKSLVKPNSNYNAAVTNYRLKIISPIATDVIKNNGKDSLTLTLKFTEPSKLANSVFLLQQTGDIIAVPSAAPFTSKILLPASTSSGKFLIGAFGRDIYGNLYADTLSVNILGTDTLKSIRMYPSSITLDSLNRETTINVTGVYTNGTDTVYRDISTGQTGTTYLPFLKNTIIAVSSNGTVSGVQAGTDTILIKNGNVTAKLPVTVNPDLLKAKKFGDTISFAVGNVMYNDPPFALNATNLSGEDINFKLLSGPVTLLNGIVTTTGVGLVKMIASDAGNPYFKKAANDTVTFQVLKANQRINFPPFAAHVFGGPNIDPAATATSGLPINYTSSNTSVATIVNGKIHTVGAGTDTITAVQPGNTDYNAAPNATQVLVISKASQTITFTAPANKKYGDPDFRLNAVSSAHLTVTYTSSNIRIATIVNGEVHLTGAGTVVITAQQTGNNDYSGSPAIDQTIIVSPADLTIIAAGQTKLYGNANPGFTLVYRGFVNGDTVINLVTPATVSTEANLTSPVGSYPINVSGAASPNYTISYINGTLVITQATRKITFNPLVSKMYASPDFDPGASISSGEPVIYTSDNAAVATIVNRLIHITGVGTANITATVAANSNYSNMPSATQPFLVTQATQTISFDAIPAQLRLSTYDLSGVTASSGLPVSLTLSDPAVASINGTTLSSNELGTESITASQAGNTNYLPATSLQQTFNVIDAQDDLVLVHNAVSPNNDGIDDVLIIEGIDKYPDNKLLMVNRNGVKVFEMTGYNNGSRVFDGHSSITGVSLQQGTYLYLLQYKVNGELKIKKGFIELRY